MYDYACYWFARELVMHHGKQNGAEYFRQYQPWDSRERMDGEVHPMTTGGDLASCLSAIRASEPVRYQRLIPGGAPSPFVAGLEREVAGPNVFLVQTASPESSPGVQPAPAWPRILGWTWETPTGARWTFGEVRPVRAGSPTGVRRLPVNWNCEAITYSAEKNPR